MDGKNYFLLTLLVQEPKFNYTLQWENIRIFPFDGL